MMVSGKWPGVHLPVVGALLCMLLSGSLGAQDVIFRPPEWIDPTGAPDVLPAVKYEEKITTPEDLRASPRIGYVCLQTVVDADGKALLQESFSTLDAYQRALRSIRTKWTPGKRGGQPVPTETLHAFIFNPASASTAGADSTPRLLEVGLGRLPPNIFKASLEQRDPQIVDAELTVSREGRVTGIAQVPWEYAQAVRVAAKNWLFAPARQGGQPVEAKVTVPFILVDFDPDEGLPPGASPAKPIKQARPVYPLAMRQSGLRGEVLIGFVINIEGRVQNPYVIRSINASFEEAALDAVRKWVFKPATYLGLPLKSKNKVPIIFSVLDEPDGGGGPFTTWKRGNLSKLPPEYQYDIEPRPKSIVRPVYPYELLRKGKGGSASVAYMVDQQGTVVYTEVIKQSSPEFGSALCAALENFEFEPALKDGKPWQAFQAFHQKFDQREETQAVSWADLVLLQWEKTNSKKIRKAEQLDEEPRPIHRPPPQFPSAAKGEKGEALIEFLIDEEGTARLPRIVRASEDAFGYAALQSVSRWKFEPPLYGGKPAVVRVQVPMGFRRQ